MKKNNGFTLIEMMVTIAIFAIIAAMAAPAFGKMVTRQKLNSNTYFDFIVISIRLFGCRIFLAKSRISFIVIDFTLCR